jgi:competence ComEA-like helix-hairpin-helix protein
MTPSPKPHKHHLVLFVCIFTPLLYLHRNELTTRHVRWDGHLPLQQRTANSTWDFHLAINSANQCELALLEDIGPTLAQRIIQTRNQLPRQRFQRVEQLRLVKGVGRITLEKIRQHLVCN